MSRVAVLAEIVVVATLGYYMPGSGGAQLVSKAGVDHGDLRATKPAKRVAAPSPPATVPTAVQPAHPHRPVRVAPVPTPSAAGNSRDERDVSRLYETVFDKRELFEELRTSGSTDSFYFAAEILQDCLDVSEQGYDAVVSEFLARLPADSPTKGQQVEAFRQIVEPCAGFDGRRSSSAEVQLLYAAGAQRGDPRATAHLLSSAGLNVATDSIRTAAALLDQRDPYVIGEVAGYLAGLYARGMVIDGETLSAEENGPVAMAWALVACDYGASCGANSRPILQACGRGGLCGLESLDELFRLTDGAMNAYERSQQYRARILAALQTRDYAALGLDASRF
jgi:hypothetical protein